MSLIVLSQPNDGAAKARIGYRNLLEEGAVVASSENANYPVANCYDWVTSDYFRTAISGTINIELTLDEAGTADYFAYYGQDLYLHGGTIKLQYHDGSGYVDASPVLAPQDNAPRMVFFDAVSATQWRVVVSCTEIFNIAVISFGEYLGLPRGMYLNWTPPKLGRANRLINSESDSGAFLGRSIISRGVKTTLQLNHAPDAWVREEWLPFVEHMEQKPFFFAPNVSAYPNECGLCWVDGENLPAPTHTNYGYMGATIQIKGLVE